jgi:tetratricopeptide (TPR) repeat protein
VTHDEFLPPVELEAPAMATDSLENEMSPGPGSPPNRSDLSAPALQETACGAVGHAPAHSAPRVGSRRSVLAVCGILLLAVIAVYGQTARYGFVNFDDDLYVYENAHVQAGLTGEGIAWAFSQRHASNWHPLTWLSLMADAQELRPAEGPLQLGQLAAKMHMINVVLHALSAAILFLVLMEMTARVWPAAFVAAVFAVHPLHVESVAWISERKDVLSGLFFMLTLAAYLGYARRPFSLLRYLLVTVLFACGLTAKPMLVTTPLVLLLLDYWPLGRFARRGAGRQPAESAADRQSARPWLEKLPWLVLAVLSCMMTYWAQEQIAVVTFQRLSLGARVANALVSYAAYLGQFVYPAGLAAFYPHPQNALPLMKIVASGLLLAGISLAVLACRRKCGYLLTGWLWYLGMLVPVIGLVQVGAQGMADRYSYLSHIGLSIALAWTVMRVGRSWRYRGCACGVGAAAVLTILLVCAWRQTCSWRDSETLWAHTLTCTARNPVAHNNLGLVLAARGRLGEAIDQYRKALEIEPGYALAHNNLGLALARSGRVEEAIDQYRDALKLKSDFAQAHYNLGVALADHGSPDEAIEHFQKALGLATVQNNAALAELIRGRIRSRQPAAPGGSSP